MKAARIRWPRGVRLWDSSAQRGLTGLYFQPHHRNSFLSRQLDTRRSPTTKGESHDQLHRSNLRASRLNLAALAVAALALFVALGGTSYAAGLLIGTKQIKNNAVTPTKIKNNRWARPT